MSSKRYFFWRDTTTGKPYRKEDGKDDGKHTPTELLSRYGNSAHVPPNGGVYWELSGNQQLCEIGIQSAAMIVDENGNELNQDDSRMIFAKAIRSVVQSSGGNSPIKSQSLGGEVNKLAAAHFAKPKLDYVLVASLSIESFPAKRIQLRDCEVLPLAKRGSKYPLPQTTQDLFGDYFNKTKYQMVKVKTTGRTVFEAADRAADALDLLRALWTLFATFGTIPVSFGQQRTDPLGVIRLGPVLTLHKPDGSLATESYWSVADFKGDAAIFTPQAGWKQIEKGRAAACRKLSHLEHRSDVERLVMRYVTALDNHNIDVAFLQLWSILEKITDTTKYDQTIERATWIFKERQFANELLEQVRYRRNQFVHSARANIGSDRIAYVVKFFLEPHLIRLIGNDFRINSLEQYARFLSLPTNVDELKTQHSRLRRAIRTLQGSP